MNYNDVLQFLSTHWFNDRKELRKARNLLLKYFPDNREFPLRYLIYDAGDNCINADELKQFIKQ